MDKPTASIASLSQYQDRLAAFLLQRGEYAGDEAALNIYRNNVMVSLTRALGDQYPAVKNLVGEQFFNALARDYVLAFPPREPALTFYGAGMAEFIREHQACRALPWLGDVANLEYCRQEVLHAADEPVLLPAHLAAIAPEQLANLRLQLRQSVQLFQSSWPVDKICAEALGDNPQKVNLENSTTSFMLVYRDGLAVDVSSLPEVSWEFLRMLAGDITLAQAWEKLQRSFALADDRLAPLLSQVLALGVFASFTLSTDNN